MRIIIFFCGILLFLVGCDKSSNFVAVKVHNKFQTRINVSYGSNLINKGITSTSVNSGETITLKSNSQYDFFNVVDCRFVLARDIIDTLSINLNGDTSKNLMYNYETSFKCEPATNNSNGTQIWILEADSSVLK